MNRDDVAFAYLHGFASGPTSAKGSHLQKVFAGRGVPLEIPDLNRPSLAELTYTGMLAAFEQHAAERGPGCRWALIGSSMGGLIAARWAELHPERMERLVLLAPGFDLPRRWSEILGPDGIADWEESGYLDYPDADGESRRIHWGLMADAQTYDPYPRIACPGLILHGRRDETVPIESSRRYAGMVHSVELVELDDDHDLIATLPTTERAILEFFAPLLPAAVSSR